MDEELGAPMHRAVVVSVQSFADYLELQVRYFRRNIWDKKRKQFTVRINRFPYVCRENYTAAAKLKPGDEIYVDPYGEEWCEPAYCNYARRHWNLRFA